MGLFSHNRKATTPKQISVIDHAGGMIVTKSLLSGHSKLKWLFRDDGINPDDSGWRAIGDTDTQEYLDNPANSIIVGFNTLVNIEPAVLSVYTMPVGTDLGFCCERGEKFFRDTKTGKRIS